MEGKGGKTSSGCLVSIQQDQTPGESTESNLLGNLIYMSIFIFYM